MKKRLKRITKQLIIIIAAFAIAMLTLWIAASGFYYYVIAKDIDYIEYKAQITGWTDKLHQDGVEAKAEKQRLIDTNCVAWLLAKTGGGTVSKLVRGIVIIAAGCMTMIAAAYAIFVAKAMLQDLKRLVRRRR